jgi:phosphoribosylglycinamide formyltransferase-1
MRKRIAVLISGRGSNMEAIVRSTKKGILKDYCEVVVVLSNRPDARGLAVAESLGVRTACIESKGKKRMAFDRELLEFLEPMRLDYVVLAGFMRILSPVFVVRYRNKIINIHPADTAAYRGLHGYEWAFENRLKTTMVTVHYVDEGVDTGPVIAQREVDLIGASNLEEVEARGLRVEHQFYSEVLLQLFRGRRADRAGG